MSRISSRLHELKSCIDDQTKKLLKMQIDLDHDELSIMLLGQHEPLKAKRPSENEILQIIHSFKKPQISKQNNVPSFNQLKKRANKIMVKQYAMKNIEIFKHRKKMGTRALEYIAIGSEINKLNLGNCIETDITSATRTIYNIQKELPNCKSVITKEDDALLKFNIKDFYKQIRKKNHTKIVLANKSNRNKQTIHLKSKQNKTKKNSKKNKTIPISNDISKSTKCKYTQLVDFRFKLGTMKYALNQHKTELTEAAVKIGIIDQNNKCQQQMQWKSVFDNESTIVFRGKKAFERVKKLQKNINKLLQKTNDNIKTISSLMNEAVWKKHGNFKNKKSMMDRVSDYKLELKKKREVYLVKKNFKSVMNQMVPKSNNNNDNKIDVTKAKTLQKRKQNDITNYFHPSAPLMKRRRLSENSNNNNNNNENEMTTAGLKTCEEEEDDNDIDL